MTKGQMIEAIWLRVKKYDPSVRRVVISSLLATSFDDMVTKYITGNPDMGHLFTKEHQQYIQLSSVGKYNFDIPYSTISTYNFNGGIYQVRSDTSESFIPVRWNELRHVYNDAVNELINTNAVMYSVKDNKMYWVGSKGESFTVDIDFIISLNEYDDTDNIPLPVISAEVSALDVLSNNVMALVLGEKPERKAIDDTNIA